MIRVKDYLVPVRFCALILQMMFTWAALRMKESNLAHNDDEGESKILGYCITMLVFEAPRDVKPLMILPLTVNKGSVPKEPLSIFNERLPVVPAGMFINDFPLLSTQPLTVRPSRH